MIKLFTQHSYFEKKPKKQQIDRLQNNPSIGWVHPKFTHARPLASGNKKKLQSCVNVAFCLKVDLAKRKSQIWKNIKFTKIEHFKQKNRANSIPYCTSNSCKTLKDAWQTNSRKLWVCMELLHFGILQKRKKYDKL